MHTFDPQIVQDFLTESGELLDQLEADLVELERSPRDPEMLNKAFRALHTIKGSASFLALTNLVRIAHAAEGALNAARSGVIVVDRGAMDLLLRTIDVLRTQMRQLGEGADLSEPPPDLVDQLTRLSEGKAPAASGATPSSPVAEARDEPGPPEAADDGLIPVVLDESKGDLLPYLVRDLEEALDRLERQLASMVHDNGGREVGAAIVETADAIRASVEFFEFEPIAALANALRAAGECVGELTPPRARQVIPRMHGVAALLAEQLEALRQGSLRRQATGVLLERLRDAAGGRELPAEGVLAADADAETALRADGVRGAIARSADAVETVAEAMPPSSVKGTSTEVGAAAAGKDEATPPKKPTSDSTIRVEVGRLEALMNLVGELVLEKNRIGAISRKLAHAIGSTHHELSEQAALAAGGLDRIAADIQTAVMRTRLQPLDKLFGKYPRLIRDLAGKTGKKIELVIEGGETEVDRSVIEELGDPLVHLLRNAADHGLEMPDERLRGGKRETGTITLRASHQGSHVKIELSDDGRGLSRERIVAKAVERGLVSAEVAATMDDRAIYPFIFEPGFSTAEKVSDLSGRGVGMDVVRTNIARIKGAIDLSSTPGGGTTVSITIPLTLAILPAMMVEVKGEVYAIPLDHVVEIVKPSKEQISTIGSTPVLRLRDTVLPLVSAVEAFGLPREEGDELPFAVILDMNQRRAGLRVGSLIGQHDIVIKPLDGVSRDGTSERNPVSGATVRDDGGVSLIVDVASLLRSVEDVKSSASSAE